jgi:hypothetical protein
MTLPPISLLMVRSRSFLQFDFLLIIATLPLRSSLLGLYYQNVGD